MQPTLSVDRLQLFYFPAMSVSIEALNQDIDRLTYKQLQQVADFISLYLEDNLQEDD